MKTPRLTEAQKTIATRLYELGHSPAEALYRAGVATAPAEYRATLLATTRHPIFEDLGTDAEMTGISDEDVMAHESMLDV